MSSFERLCACCWTKQCLRVISWPPASHVCSQPPTLQTVAGRGGSDGPL
jgi:hypothetical protein